MCPGTAIGFFWALGGWLSCEYSTSSSLNVIFQTAAAERREFYRFSADLGKLGLRIAETHGTSAEKW